MWETYSAASSRYCCVLAKCSTTIFFDESWFCEAFHVKSLVQLDSKCIILVSSVDWRYTFSIHGYHLHLHSSSLGGKIINTREMQWEFLDVWNQLNVCGNLLGSKWICLPVQLPLSSPSSAKPERWFPGTWFIGHALPPWAVKPHQLKELWILSSWQNVNLQVLQYIEHGKEQDICEQLLGGQRWVETFAFFLRVYCSC